MLTFLLKRMKRIVQPIYHLSEDCPALLSESLNQAVHSGLALLSCVFHIASTPGRRYQNMQQAGCKDRWLLVLRWQLILVVRCQPGFKICGNPGELSFSLLSQTLHCTLYQVPELSEVH